MSNSEDRDSYDLGLYSSSMSIKTTLGSYRRGNFPQNIMQSWHDAQVEKVMFLYLPKLMSDFLSANATVL